MSAGSELRIRDALEEDRPRIREITLAAYAEYAEIMTPSAWGALRQALLTALETGSTADQIVAERRGRLVGSVMLYPPATDAYGGAAARVGWPELRLLAVAPEARGQGVGRALVEECVRRARQIGAVELGLHSSESMRVAIGMYERMGFVRAPEFDFQPSGAELVRAYRLPLRDPGRSG